MSLHDSPGPARFWTGRRAIMAGVAAVALAAGTTVALSVDHPGVSSAAGTKSTHLAASTCSGPAGAAYVALPGYQAFDAIDTDNCYITQVYNVADPDVPGFPGDTNYAGTDDGVAIHGDTLYFAVTGENEVAVIDAATLNPKDYNPTETDIHVGFNPDYVAVTPDGSQLWAADTGPQTGPASP